MIAFVIRRLLLAIPTILVVITVVFFSVRGLGGDAAMAILGDRATPQALEAMRERLGLNQPLWKQYTSFLGDLAQGDLGRDLRTDQPVSELFKRAVPYTIDLAVWATIIGILIGVPAGVLSALKWNTPLDFIGRFVGILGFSFPTFYLSIILLYVFSLTLNWFPMIGGGEMDNLMERAWHLFLPALSLGLIKSAFVMRLTRSSMLNVLHEDYVTTARSKGLKEWVVIYKHALRNSLIPVVTMIALYLAVTIGGSIEVEIVFNRPGLGKFLIGAIQERNYPVIQSGLVVLAVFIVIVNLITDLSYALIDPRIKFE
jgi:ABC-type dipeptide/oligopeptide/nickel transport system permease component